MKKIVIFFLSFIFIANSFAQSFTQKEFEEDFLFFWKEIKERYAYFHIKQTDWNKVKEAYYPQIEKIKTKNDFISFLEKVTGELYDSHLYLTTNLNSSFQLAPTGLDMWVEWKNGKAIITEIKANSLAEKAGCKVGMEIVEFNHTPIKKLASAFLPQCLKKGDSAAYNYTLRLVIGGDRINKRIIKVKNGEKLNTFTLDPVNTKNKYNSLLNSNILSNNIGYIEFNNSLSNMKTIVEFDDALEKLKDTKALILDLRNTPSGGNTMVAKGIMGRLIDKELPYQRCMYPSDLLDSLHLSIQDVEYDVIAPRNKFIYTKPIIVLVDHWTASMGEGIAIGMDGIKRGTIVGTKMAELVGAIEHVELPHTKLGVNYPYLQLFHMNKTAREDFVPSVFIDFLQNQDQKSDDLILEKGLQLLK